MSNFGMAYSAKKKYARGGKVQSDMDHGQKRGPEGYGKYQEQAQNQKGIHTPVSGVTEYPGGKGTSRAGDYTKDRYGGKPTFSGADHPAKEEHKRVLSEMQSMPKPNLMAHGGEVEEDAPIHHIVRKVLMGRAKGYSEGGEVANEDHDMAKELPNEFDDLALDDSLSQHDTGANSGDALGDEQEDEDRHDIISRVMKSRSKKDRNPSPA